MTTQIATVGAQLGAAVHQSDALSVTGVLERIFARLFHGLVYPQIWEDPVVDMTALGIRRTDDIVCIASGGCNLMSYLTARPRSITAVDLSPAHVALAQLKLAAARHLTDFDRFYDFFGHANKPSNVLVFDYFLASRLDRKTRTYWEERTFGRRRIEMFRRGVYRYGLLGRFLGSLHLVSWIAGVDFHPFLAASSLEEQRRFFEQRIAPLFDLAIVRIVARHRAALFGLGIPPAQYDKLARDGAGDVIPVLRERVRKLMCDFPVRENYFAWQACTRAYAPVEPRAVPPYLDRAQFDVLRETAGRVRVLNRSLTDQLELERAGSKDCFSLLDAQDWMTDRQLDQLWQQITRTAAPGARVIFRTGGRADILPGRAAPLLLAQWRYDRAASDAGFRADRSAIYGGFHVYRKAD